MDRQYVYVGRLVPMPDRTVQDWREEVIFEGEKLASRVKHAADWKSNAGFDPYETVETIYRTADGQLLVYVTSWSGWPANPTIESLRELSEVDIQPGGRFHALGALAGLVE